MNLRLLALIVVLLSLASASIWLQEEGKQGDEDPAQKQAKQRHVPDYYMDNFEMTTMDDLGRPSSLLISDKMLHYPDDDSTELNMPTMTLYRETGKPWIVRSDRGWVAADNKLVLLSGNVVIDRHSGPDNRPVKLLTERLRIHPKTDFAETDQPVTMLSEKRKTTAIGMRAYVREGQLQLLDDVRVHYEQ
ncbi:LPS export ABC transporter periplasmic protein LptC [Sulfuriflexus mobilis]|uniref:LPS export ABC transporter periplasmic protein LptC n=1 Tax=Sulfuriflexus mobilis TaxID=1811807 RepID=UPI000F81D083|nr:LPS export ABC transporter periplasmic protein LptC [Sulfuriflexus mobilis]